MSLIPTDQESDRRVIQEDGVGTENEVNSYPVNSRGEPAAVGRPLTPPQSSPVVPHKVIDISKRSGTPLSDDHSGGVNNANTWKLTLQEISEDLLDLD